MMRPYFISVDSLTLFPNTRLYQLEKEGKFIEAGEKERLEELLAYRKNLDSL